MDLPRIVLSVVSHVFCDFPTLDTRAIARTPEADAGRECKSNCREKTQKKSEKDWMQFCAYSFVSFRFFVAILLPKS